MKKILLTILGLLLISNAVVYAAPATRFDVSILPITDSTFELGTTTKKWLRAFFDDVNFYGEIKPDGSTCANGEILKKTGTNDWDCAADNASGGVSGGTADFLTYWVNATTLGATSSPTVAYITATSTSIASQIPLASSTAITVASFYPTNINSQIRALSGTSVAPGISFQADTSSGLFLSGGNVSMTVGGTPVLQFNGSGSIVYPSDNLYDFGASGATRPRTGYFGTSLIAPVLDTGQGLNELYDMDQNVLTTSDVTFGNATSTGNLGFSGEIQPDGALCSNGQILKKTAANDWDCAADNNSGGGGSFPFTTTTNFGQTANATTTAIWMQGTPISLMASSTAIFDYASTTMISVGAGAVGSPSFTFTSDPNTGIYNSAADAVSITVGGVVAARFSSAGITAPTSGDSFIHSIGGTATAPAFTNSGISAGMFLGSDSVGFSTNDTERAAFVSNGNFVIGTTTPNLALVTIATSTAPQLSLVGVATDNPWNLVTTSGGSFYIATSSPTTFATSSVAAVFISKDGQPAFPYLKSCNTIDSDANGVLTCGTDATGAGGGDEVSIDGVAVTNPDFVSTGDIDFVDTANTVTANINASSIVAGDIANGDHGDFTYSSNSATLDANTVDTNELADATLDALSAYNTNGLVTQTAADTFTGRTITAGGGISVTNGNGVSGNPAVALTVATSTVPNILAISNPVGVGAYQQSMVVDGTNDLWRGPTYVASSTTAKIGHHGSFAVPENCNDSVYSIFVPFTVAVTSGDVVIDLDVASITGDDSESFDVSAWDETLTVTDTAPSATLERLTQRFNLSAANIAPGDTMIFALSRDGADANDTAAGGVLFSSASFQCSI